MSGIIPGAHGSPVPPAPFAELANILELAQHDNVAIEISGACTILHEGFPHKDIREPLERIVAAL